MPTYIRKPKEIEAIQWDHNRGEVMHFCRDLVSTTRDESRIGFESGPGGKVFIYPDRNSMLRLVVNLVKWAWPMDYIIKNGPKDYSIMDREEFEKKYQLKTPAEAGD
jgi:hypothetical protein